MSYRLTSRRRPAPQPPLSGFWGDAYGLLTEASNKVIDPIAALIPGTPAYAEKQVALISPLTTKAKAQAEVTRLANLAAQHGGVAVPSGPGTIPSDFLKPKTYGDQGTSTGGKLLLAGALGVGVFFLWKKTRRAP
jgi:hypothetical protein